MFETGVRQLRMALSMAGGRPFSPTSLTRLVGDAVATWPGVMLGWPQINMDEKQNRASMHKLCDLSNAEVLSVGHGDPVVQGGADTLKDLVAGRETRPVIASA